MKKFGMFLIALLLWSCYKTTYQQEFNFTEMSLQVLEKGKLTFITNDTIQYKLDIHTINDEFIIGEGRFKKPGKEWDKFAGTVRLDNIHLFLLEDTDYLKSIVINGSVLYLAINFSNSQEGPTIPKLEFAGPSGGSCPFIYSKTDTGFVLEAEAISTALGKALETETINVLPALEERNNELQVRISNERPETHYLNKVQLYAAEHPRETIVFLDQDNQPWPVTELCPPSRAYDHSNNEITSLLAHSDHNYWKSDLRNTSALSSLEDFVEVEFNRPLNRNTGSLVIRSINTALINSVYNVVFNFLDDETLRFLYDLENDTSLINQIHQWIQKCALKIDIWNGAEWQLAGSIQPEANAVDFNRLMRIEIPANVKGAVRLRLHSIPDVWRLDQVAMDWSDANKINTKEVKMLSCVGSPILNISDADDRYTTLFPNQHVYFSFSSLNPAPDKKTTYMIKVRGYLHEWISSTRVSDMTNLNFSNADQNKIEFLRFLLRNERLLLPAIYLDWKHQKTRL